MLLNRKIHCQVNNPQRAQRVHLRKPKFVRPRTYRQRLLYRLQQPCPPNVTERRRFSKTQRRPVPRFQCMLSFLHLHPLASPIYPLNSDNLGNDKGFTKALPIDQLNSDVHTILET